MKNNKVKVVVIQESKLTSYIQIQEPLHPELYHSVCKDRPRGQEGGLLIFIDL